MQKRTWSKVSKYRDIKTALAEGYTISPKGGREPFVHVTKPSSGQNAILPGTEMDNLLYRTNKNGTYTLVGVMYDVPKGGKVPSVAGGIGRFHVHGADGMRFARPGETVTSDLPAMMHMWFSRDLADAYSDRMPTAHKRGGRQA